MESACGCLVVIAICAIGMSAFTLFTVLKHENHSPNSDTSRIPAQVSAPRPPTNKRRQATPRNDETAGVDCVLHNATDEVRCIVKNNQAVDDLHVCWDVVMKCSGPVRIKARACQNVRAAGTAMRSMSFDEFSADADTRLCGNIKSSDVKNATATPIH